MDPRDEPESVSGGATVVAQRPAMGCICPPGANLDCQAPLCPRRPLPVGAR
jgi:hypothetical protein